MEVARCGGVSLQYGMRMHSCRGRGQTRGPFRLCQSSGMDLEGQQLLRVHVVEGAQVGQLQQQLGEDGRLIGVVPGDEAPQRADQRLLQRLHRVHVLDAGAVCRETGCRGVQTHRLAQTRLATPDHFISSAQKPLKFKESFLLNQMSLEPDMLPDL